MIRQKQSTDRPGIYLWQIFVMAMFRIPLGFSYYRLHTMANNNKMLRQLLGIETESGFQFLKPISNGLTKENKILVLN